MSHDELHRYFDAVLTSPPNDGTDIDAAIATAQRLRRRRLSAYAAGGVACTLLVGTLALTTWPGGPSTHEVATSPASGSPKEPSETTPAERGVLVTSVEQLYGVWRTVELDGVAIDDHRSQGWGPLQIRFQQHESKSWWSANDTCNDQFGSLTVEGGRFSATGNGSTLVGCSPSPVRERNPEVVKEADEARIEGAATSGTRQLYLLHAGVVTGVYTYQPMGHIHGLFELEGGPAAHGGSGTRPASIEDLELRDENGTVVSANTDGHGVFDIEAPAGDYVLVTARRCPDPVDVHISDQQTTKVTITCQLR